MRGIIAFSVLFFVFFSCKNYSQNKYHTESGIQLVANEIIIKARRIGLRGNIGSTKTAQNKLSWKHFLNTVP